MESGNEVEAQARQRSMNLIVERLMELKSREQIVKELGRSGVAKEDTLGAIEEALGRTQVRMAVEGAFRRRFRLGICWAGCGIFGFLIAFMGLIPMDPRVAGTLVFAFGKGAVDMTVARAGLRKFRATGILMDPTEGELVFMDVKPQYIYKYCGRCGHYADYGECSLLRFHVRASEAQFKTQCGGTKFEAVASPPGN
jgi:hypothetical protein